jgi:hypothetical protein
MSLGLCCLLCFGFYKLGAYQQRRPGETIKKAMECWTWMKQ